MTTNIQNEKAELLLALMLRPGTDVNIDAKQFNGKPLTTLTSAGANRDAILISLDKPLSPRLASDIRTILTYEASLILKEGTTKDLIDNHKKCFALMLSEATPKHRECLQNQMQANIKTLQAASKNLISEDDRALCFEVGKKALEIQDSVLAKIGEERQ